MNVKTIMAITLVSSGLTASATVLLSKQAEQAPVQNSVATLEKIQSMTSPMMTMQRPL